MGEEGKTLKERRGTSVFVPNGGPNNEGGFVFVPFSRLKDPHVLSLESYCLLDQREAAEGLVTTKTVEVQFRQESFGQRTADFIKHVLNPCNGIYTRGLDAVEFFYTRILGRKTCPGRGAKKATREACYWYEQHVYKPINNVLDALTGRSVRSAEVPVVSSEGSLPSSPTLG